MKFLPMLFSNLLGSLDCDPLFWYFQVVKVKEGTSKQVSKLTAFLSLKIAFVCSRYDIRSKVARGYFSSSPSSVS